MTQQLGTFLVIGKYENETVHLFDEPVVAVHGDMQEGDIARLENEYIRFYRDGHTGNLRSFFITNQVRAAYDERDGQVEDTIQSFIESARGM